MFTFDRGSLGKLGVWQAAGSGGLNVLDEMRSGFAGYRDTALSTSQWTVMGGTTVTRTNLKQGQISFGTMFGNASAHFFKSQVIAKSIDRTTFYPNTALLPGSNGMYDGTFMGVATMSVGGNGQFTEGMLLYGVMGQGGGPRPFFNVYAVSPSGGDAYTIWSRTYHNDAICDNATVVWNATRYKKRYEPKNFYSSADWLYVGMGSRWQNDGTPFVTFGAYNGASSPADSGTYRNFATLGSMNAWGQPLDACDVPSSSDQPIGLFMWQRQWWGPMVTVIRRTGSAGNSFTQHNVTYLNMYYQSWIYENDSSGNQGGVTYSPVSNRVYPIFIYEPQNQGGGGITGGSGMAIVSYTLEGDIDGTGYVGGNNDSRKNDLIAFIWGGECKPYFGWNMAPSIQYLGDYYGYDAIAYGWISETGGVRLRFTYYDPEGRDACSYPIIEEYTNMGTYNVQQRTRIEVIAMDEDQNNGIWRKVAFSWVDSSNNTQVRIITIESDWTIAQYDDWNPTISNGGARGALGKNGTVYGASGAAVEAGNILRHSHGLVVQGTNSNNMTTHIWSQPSHGFGTDQDRSYILKTI